MSDAAKRNWSALDGCLVIDFEISRTSDDVIASLAKIRCGSGNADERVLIYASRRNDFSINCASGCYIRGYFQQRNHVHIEGVDCIGIFADIHFGIDRRYEEQHFEGLMVTCPSDQPPKPPIPPPRDLDNTLPILVDQVDELFPYVYVRRWPKVSDEDLEYGFIQYLPESPPGGQFIDDLAVARDKGRSAAEALALRFIDGEPPYQGQFVGNPHWLSKPMRALPRLAERFAARETIGEPWLAELCAALHILFEHHGQTPAYLNDNTLRTEIDRIWQSYFALVVTLGYEPALLNDLALCLWLVHLIQQAFAVDAEGHWVVKDLTPEQISLLSRATIILPASVFPLPPAVLPLASPPGPAKDGPAQLGWIEPYAIGDLQMVRQRLVRYAVGEIARIENVVRGERREVASRHKHRRVEVRQEVGEEQQVLATEDGDDRFSLLEGTRKTIAEKAVEKTYDNFQTSYGPPTQATLNGSWSRTTTPKSSGFEDVTRFAREVLSKTVNRISRNVSAMRASGTLSQTEDLVSSVIDNTAGDANVCAVFRWLNKVYEASVVNYGNRLMMEFLLLAPAAGFIASEAALRGGTLAEPIHPEQLGITSFKAIEPETYDTICAAYGVTDIAPPPSAHVYAAATLRGGEEKLIAIPAGYAATAAIAASLAGGLTPQVLVGSQVLAAGVSTPLTAYADTAALPVSVRGVAPTLSPPSEVEVLVTVEIQCSPTDRAMDEWRISVYSAVAKAYQERARAYYRDTRADDAHRLDPRSPLANRLIERRVLKAGCMRLLLVRMLEQTGATAAASALAPSPWAVYEPRVIQFLDDAIEWREMGYSFHISLADGAEPAGLAPDDPLFTSFLQSSQARVLVPVRPDRLMAFLYFLSSGMIWEGADWLIGADSGQVPLIDDHKHAPSSAGPPRVVGAPWTVVVPTSMEILDTAAALAWSAEGAA